MDNVILKTERTEMKFPLPFITPQIILEAIGNVLHSEMEKVEFFDELPKEWTYPLIQPKLIEEAQKRGIC